MTGFYLFVVRWGPAFLIFVSVAEFVGSLVTALSLPVRQGFLFSLAVALGAASTPFIAASVLLRFDRWLGWTMHGSQE